MENSSKALLMAAEVLVGVLLLTLMATLFYIATDYQKEVSDNIAAKKLYEFNAKFQVYEDTDLTAQDVLTVLNLIDDYNSKYGNLIEIIGIKEIRDKKNFLNPNQDDQKVYEMKIINYAVDGKINKIQIKEKT